MIIAVWWGAIYGRHPPQPPIKFRLLTNFPSLAGSLPKKKDQRNGGFFVRKAFRGTRFPTSPFSGQIGSQLLEYFYSYAIIRGSDRGGRARVPIWFEIDNDDDVVFLGVCLGKWKLIPRGLSVNRNPN